LINAGSPVRHVGAISVATPSIGFTAAGLGQTSAGWTVAPCGAAGAIAARPPTPVSSASAISPRANCSSNRMTNLLVGPGIVSARFSMQ
jgi:hypothetical protein